MSESIIAEPMLYTNNGSDACIVWFGGIREPFINPAFLKTYPNAVFDGLFLTDARADWYMAGFSGIAEDFASSVEWLRKFIADHRYRRIFLSGQSSGAYAALRVARHIRPTAVIAFAPQTRNLVDNRGIMQPWVNVEDLGLLYSDWENDFPIYIHVSRSEDAHKEQFFWDDWNQIKPFLTIDNVTIIRHPFDYHAVGIHLYQKDIFYKTLLLTALLYCD
ncbi:MAG TPA: hypothetical protein VKQ73_03400 [Stellaceae bacterium]|nr:hypothetical protein [Stellaceae bacterium]